MIHLRAAGGGKAVDGRPCVDESSNVTLYHLVCALLRILVHERHRYG